MNDSSSIYAFALAVSLLVLCSGTAGNACEREVNEVTNSNSVSALVEGTGSVPVALNLSYRVTSDSGQSPGAISVFVRREDSESSNDWLLVDRIFPFAPSRSGEMADATIAIPQELQQFFEQRDQIVIGLGFEESLTQQVPQTEILELDRATVIFD